MAIAVLVDANSTGVRGALFIKDAQLNGQPAVSIAGQIYGLSMGQHGFHVHAGRGTGNGCKDAKGHFNPFGVSTADFFVPSIY